MINQKTQTYGKGPGSHVPGGFSHHGRSVPEQGSGQPSSRGAQASATRFPEEPESNAVKALKKNVGDAKSTGEERGYKVQVTAGDYQMGQHKTL